MTAVDITERSQTEALAFEFDLPHAPEKVWRALTDPELLSEWLLPVAGFKLGVGNQFALQAPPKPGWDGRVACQLLEIEPMRKLRYSWVVGDFLDTVVTFTMSPSASGTHLLLVQSGFTADQKQNFGGARYGWRLMGTRLVELLGRIS